MAIHKNNKFKGEYCEQLIQTMASGKSYIQFLADLNVGVQTFYEWIDRYPNFAEAYKVGKVRGQAYWEAKIHDNLFDERFNVGAAKWLMGQRYGMANHRSRRKNWLHPADIMGSLERLCKLYETDVVSDNEFNADVKALLDIATLKEKHDITKRVEELEELIRERELATDEPEPEG